MQIPKIVVIGGGFSGLLVSYLLQKEGVSSKILEARDRLGGRIYTVRSGNGPSLEMGATWLGKKHHHLTKLLNELGVSIKEQYMGSKGYYEPMSVSPPQLVDLPPNEEPSYRIDGGTDTIIKKLTDNIDQNQIQLNQVVKSIQKTGEGFEIHTDQNVFKADFAISTLPPKLLLDRIQFLPSLPGEFIEIASKTHTWMAESIKVALTFEQPFWRASGSSGTIFSNVGPITEMYDHSSDRYFALKGFMNSAYHSISREEREQLVIDQLRRFYGNKIENYISYREMVWQDEPFSFSKYEQPVYPHQNNGHVIYQKLFFDERFILSGSETATEFPGYMDGAVESARRSVIQLKQLLA